MAKKGAKGGGKKAGGAKAQKQVKKIVEDKTFGMKNKNKSAKVQKYVNTVQKQVESQKGIDQRRRQQALEKQRAKAEELLSLTQASVVPKKRVEKGVDPKSVLCEFFKRGNCQRGNKCKFSHDLKVERKAEKIDLFTDRREEDDMELWDQEKLESVINNKHGSEVKANKTKIVCKYFIDAVENKKYGWFWECPNGRNDCRYVHALPPGYVFKSQKKAEEEQQAPLIEDVVEEQRAQLTSHTPVTLELFLAWKEKKRLKKLAEEKAQQKKKKADHKAGKQVLSGRELFNTQRELFVDDDAAASSTDMQVQDSLDDVAFATRITATATSITSVSLKKLQADSKALDDEQQAERAQELAESAQAAQAADASLFADVDDLDDDET